MPETLLFSIFIFALLWPFFMYLDVMNFRKDPNAMEDHLPGRPARRTIGRKNEDMSKAIGYVFVGYILANGALYAFLNYSDLLPLAAYVAMAWLAYAVAMYLFSPANRLMHAYANLGHIAVVHLVATLCSFMILATFIYGYQPTLNDSLCILGCVVGAMMIFSARPNAPKKSKSSKDGEVY